MVIDWLPPGTAEAATAPDDPWAKPRRQDQRTVALRLRKAFYACTPTEEGTPKQKAESRRKQFTRALGWAEQEQLIAAHEIEGVTYLRLSRPDVAGEAEVPES